MKSLSKHIPFFLILLAAKAAPLQSQPLSDHPPGYAVASGHPLATQAGLAMLAQGGNAFDAAIAVASTLAVVEPYDSGLGGGAFWLLHDEKTHKNIFLDARELAPLKAHKDMFLTQEGKVIPGASLNGGLAAAIPGQPAALVYVAKHYGTLPLSTSLGPAMKLAKDGFLVDTQLHYLSASKERVRLFNQYPATSAIFLKKGKAFAIGERLLQPDLAKTLSLIACKGKKGFYEGEVAERLVKGVTAAGGLWTLDDLKHYQVKVREPLVGMYQDMVIITAPPPSAGGVDLLTMLNVLSQFPLSSYSKIQWIHFVVESMRLAYWQRDQYLGDPDFISIPIKKLLSKENANFLATLISPDKAGHSEKLSNASTKAGNTSHFSIIDAQGNRVAVTQTLNYYFGSSVVPEGTGVLLNNGMDDFSVKVGEPNVFGVIGSEKNRIEPGKRPLSSMTPTFLELPTRIAVVGTPGGSRIPTMMLIASLVFNDSYGAISMVSAMRFHHQYFPDVIEIEPDTFSPSIQASLTAMGYHLKQLTKYYGNMQAITWDRTTNHLTAASDPRHIGLSTAVLVSKQRLN